MPELRSARMSLVLCFTVRGLFGKHLIIVLSCVLMSVVICSNSTFTFFILALRKFVWHIIHIKSVILQSINSFFVAFGCLLVDNMLFDAVIEKYEKNILKKF